MDGTGDFFPENDIGIESKTIDVATPALGFSLMTLL